MGLFGKKDKTLEGMKPEKVKFCEFCDKKFSFFNFKVTLRDQHYICTNCCRLINVGNDETMIRPNQVTYEDAQERFRILNEYYRKFSVTTSTPFIDFDFKNYVVRFNGTSATHYIDFNKILRYEVIEETSTQIIEEAPNANRPNAPKIQKVEEIVSLLKLKITTNISELPYFYIQYYRPSTPEYAKTSFQYKKKFEELTKSTNVLDRMMHNRVNYGQAPTQSYRTEQAATAPVQPVAAPPVQPAQPIEPAPNNTETTIKLLREFKSLLDDGIITQEEFDQKKKELL